MEKNVKEADMKKKGNGIKIENLRKR